MKELVDAIVALEWEAFQQVHNVGGRASCQDDYLTFSVSRKSQFLAWDSVARESYLNDLRRAKAGGRNLLMEKYARMMAWTAPQEYATLEKKLPSLTEESLRLADEIAAAVLAWQSAFAESHPGLAARARPVLRRDEAGGVTSFETYIRGELLTYSPRTLRALAAHVKQLKEQGLNMSTLTMEHTARLNGWGSLAEAEARAG